MIFKLLCKNKNNQEETWLYDNFNNCFYDSNGYRRFYDSSKNGNLKIYPFNKEDNINRYNSNSVEDVFIFLGNKCNFHCDHCIQKYNKLDYKVRDEDIDYISNLIKRFDRLRMIAFQAGEPMVYWKIISKFIIKIREVFSDRENLKINITTNGSLIDREKIDFIKKYKVNLIISYDGKNSYRDYDILSKEKIVDALKYAIDSKVKFIFNYLSVPYTKNTFSETKEYVKNILGDEGYVFDYGKITLMFSNINFNKDKELEKLIPDDKESERLKNEFLSDLNSGVDNVGHRRILNIEKEIKCSEGYNYHGCGIPIGKTLVLDVKGNVFSCKHDFSKIIGNIKDLDSIKLNRYVHPLRKKKCQECEYLSLCNGGSMRLNDGKLFDFNCIHLKIKYKAFFEYIMEKMFNLKLCGIEKYVI